MIRREMAQELITYVALGTAAESIQHLPPRLIKNEDFASQSGFLSGRRLDCSACERFGERLDRGWTRSHRNL
jgi:hypothetical protein